MIDLNKVKNTTLCYIERDGEYLMMHRIKKQNDVNHGKWIGIGGKFEENETPLECALREIKEETGVVAYNLKYRGIVNFISDIFETEVMHLFTTDSFDGDINFDCNEGVLKWVKKTEVLDLNLWEGDRIFLDFLTQDRPFFKLTLTYKGDTLIDYKVEE
jgi:8-oxo-dGTP diphosphatase